jgi:predicted small metal-binding protein
MVQKDKEIYCRDIGIDCDSVVCGKTEKETLNELGQHVLAIHGIEGFSKDFYNKARSAIHDGTCEHKDFEEMISEDPSADYASCFDCGDDCCCCGG